MIKIKRTALQGMPQNSHFGSHDTMLSSWKRVLTVIQVLWFSINCIGRLAQRMALTTLELTTLAFIYSMLATSVCWRHKPLDVSYPITLETDITIAEILTKVSTHYLHSRCGFTNGAHRPVLSQNIPINEPPLTSLAAKNGS